MPRKKFPSDSVNYEKNPVTTMRFDPDDLDGLDRLASEWDMPRNHLVVTLVRRALLNGERKPMIFTISYEDDKGRTVELAGEPEWIARELEERGYDGPSIKLLDEPGFVRGYVSAGHYSLR